MNSSFLHLGLWQFGQGHVEVVERVDKHNIRTKILLAEHLLLTQNFKSTKIYVDYYYHYIS